MIATHIDTVPSWGFRRANFPISRRGRIYGRGAIDTKGQIASLLLAIEKTDEPTTVALFVDEEKEGKGSKVFSPKNRFEGALVLEPTDFKISTMQAGSIEIYIETYGKISHGSKPKKVRVP